MFLILAAGLIVVMLKKPDHTSQVKSQSNPATAELFDWESDVRLDQAKRWAMGCLLFAGDHGNQLPKNFEQIKSHVPGLPDSNWEIVSGGNENSFTNTSQNSRIILLREKDSRQSPGGEFVKAYAFIDGHAEMVMSPDSDFAAQEKHRGLLVRLAEN